MTPRLSLSSKIVLAKNKATMSRLFENILDEATRFL